MVCLGAATRLIEYVQRMRKRYEATFLLGRFSDTEDCEGTVTELANPAIPSQRQIESLLSQFTGTINQQPPAYSALKVQGERAYAVARRGEVPLLAPRPVVIYELKLVAFDYPQLTLDIRCGSGTYVRSLGRDLAVALGTQAIMSALLRREIGPYHADQALSADDISPQTIESHLLPPQSALADFPSLVLTQAEETNIRNGRVISRVDYPPGTELQALSSEGRLLALLTAVNSGLLQPKIVFP